ncbi:hypothetical protein P3T35_003009 [Kitasatospora sp. GP30]|uniref:hypothetical protein n=1 Tax=Kitasatospora sp. GP30 TaxID=3035084 RepID=UPI000C707357|nr:hypothetical protein [Kitasatospora sp. GP30]MDH6140996.1 hypothetical protein [Kitasatospora sp. GP30]
MNDEFSSALSEELSGLSEPPIGDLVGQAARRGRRIRRFRAAGATVAVAAVATVAALITGSLAGPGHSDPQQVGVAAATRTSGPVPTAPPSASGPASTTPPTALPNPSSSASGPMATPGGNAPASASPGAAVSNPALVPATPLSLLAAVVKALPGNPQTSHYGADPADPSGELAAQAYQTDSRGTSMVRVFLSKADGPLSCDGSTFPCQVATDGQGLKYRVMHVPDNSIQSTVVTVLHTDGSLVTVQLSTRLANDGTGTLPLSFEALTVDQAEHLAADPSISMTMPEQQVAQAAQQYANTPTFN